MEIAGSGGGASPQTASPPTPPRTADANTGEAARSPAPGQAGPDLVATAANGGPVESGEALRLLDERNGNPQTTDIQVQAARSGGADPTGWSVSRSYSVEVETSGGTTTTTGTSADTRVSADGYEQVMRAHTVTTASGSTTWSFSAADSTTYTTRRYDEHGRAQFDPVTEQPLWNTESKAAQATTATLDQSGAALTTAITGQEGSVNGGVSSTVAMNDDGVGAQTIFSAGGGPVEGRAGGGVRYGENGLAVNGMAGLNIGPAFGGVTVTREEGANGVKDTSTAAVGVAVGEGGPVGGRLEYRQTDVRELTRNEDGTTTYQVTGQAQRMVGAGVDVGGAGVDAAWTNGQRTVHTVTVPAGADVTAVDPTRPQDWPEGTRVVIRSEDYQGSTLELSYARFGLQAGQESRSGAAIVLERGAGGSVHVAAGPTEGFTASGRLEFDLAAGFGASLGGENRYDFASYRTFDLDLSAPGGAQTLADVLVGRGPPTANANGVSGLMETTIADYRYTGALRFNTPFGDVGPELREGGQALWRSFPDGRVEYAQSYDVDADGAPELITSSTSPDGRGWSETDFTFRVTIDDEVALDNYARFAPTSGVRIGDTVDVKITGDELELLRGSDEFSGFGLPGETEDMAAANRFGLAEHIARIQDASSILSSMAPLISAGSLSPGDVVVVRN